MTPPASAPRPPPGLLPLATRDGTLQVGVVASDLDRTLTGAGLRPSRAALRALGEAQAEGVLVVLVTGRRAEELAPALLARFDALALEGGAVVGRAEGGQADLRPVAAARGWVARVAARLDAQGVPYDAGAASVSVEAVHAVDVARLGGLVLASPNRDRIDLTPPGVDKGTGLRAARALLRRTGRGAAGACLAFGDAENDLPLLAAADYGVAVANAEPVLKAAAHEVAPGAGGAGVARFLRRRLLARPAPSQPSRPPPSHPRRPS